MEVTGHSTKDISSYVMAMKERVISTLIGVGAEQETDFTYSQLLTQNFRVQEEAEAHIIMIRP